jgi:hypothetical protein
MGLIDRRLAGRRLRGGVPGRPAAGRRAGAFSSSSIWGRITGKKEMRLVEWRRRINREEKRREEKKRNEVKCRGARSERLWQNQV